MWALTYTQTQNQKKNKNKICVWAMTGVWVKQRLKDTAINIIKLDRKEECGYLHFCMQHWKFTKKRHCYTCRPCLWACASDPDGNVTHWWTSSVQSSFDSVRQHCLGGWACGRVVNSARTFPTQVLWTRDLTRLEFEFRSLDFSSPKGKHGRRDG